MDNLEKIKKLGNRVGEHISDFIDTIKNAHTEEARAESYGSIYDNADNRNQLDDAGRNSDIYKEHGEIYYKRSTYVGHAPWNYDKVKPGAIKKMRCHSIAKNALRGDLLEDGRMADGKAVGVGMFEDAHTFAELDNARKFGVTEIVVSGEIDSKTAAQIAEMNGIKTS